MEEPNQSQDSANIQGVYSDSELVDSGMEGENTDFLEPTVTQTYGRSKKIVQTSSDEEEDIDFEHLQQEMNSILNDTNNKGVENTIDDFELLKASLKHTEIDMLSEEEGEVDANGLNSTFHKLNLNPGYKSKSSRLLDTLDNTKLFDVLNNENMYFQVSDKQDLLEKLQVNEDNGNDKNKIDLDDDMEDSNNNVKKKGKRAPLNKKQLLELKKLTDRMIRTAPINLNLEPENEADEIEKEKDDFSLTRDKTSKVPIVNNFLELVNKKKIENAQRKREIYLKAKIEEVGKIYRVQKQREYGEDEEVIDVSRTINHPTKTTTSYLKSAPIKVKLLKDRINKSNQQVSIYEETARLKLLSNQQHIKEKQLKQLKSIDENKVTETVDKQDDKEVEFDADASFNLSNDNDKDLGLDRIDYIMSQLQNGNDEITSTPNFTQHNTPRIDPIENNDVELEEEDEITIATDSQDERELSDEEILDDVDEDEDDLDEDGLPIYDHLDPNFLSNNRATSTNSNHINLNGLDDSGDEEFQIQRRPLDNYLSDADGISSADELQNRRRFGLTDADGNKVDYLLDMAEEEDIYGQVIENNDESEEEINEEELLQELGSMLASDDNEELEGLESYAARRQLQRELEEKDAIQSYNQLMGKSKKSLLGNDFDEDEFEIRRRYRNHPDSLISDLSQKTFLDKKGNFTKDVDKMVHLDLNRDLDENMVDLLNDLPDFPNKARRSVPDDYKFPTENFTLLPTKRTNTNYLNLLDNTNLQLNEKTEITKKVKKKQLPKNLNKAFGGFF